jgi:hypothetical protein
MSVARLHHVKSARKAQGKCGGCEKTISKGKPYVWWTIGFRARFKHKRCGDCKVPPPSARESNSSVSMLLAAGEGLADALAAALTPDDVKAAVDAAAEGVRDAISDWEEKKENLEQAFPNGSPAIEEIEEHLSNAESLAEALESFEVEEADEPEEGEEKEEDADIEAARESAQSCWDDNNQF